MNKKQGYYSWIHSMNRAAIEAHQKGHEMRKKAKELKEAKEEEEMTPEQKQTLAQIRAEKVARGEKRNLSRLQGQDPDAVGDVKPAGDAHAVASDASDGVVGDEEDALDTDPFVTKQNLPTYSLAAKAREETRQLAVADGKEQKQKFKAKRREERVAARHAATQEPETSVEVVTPEGQRMMMPMESVTEKINRLMNG